MIRQVQNDAAVQLNQVWLYLGLVLHLAASGVACTGCPPSSSAFTSLYMVLAQLGRHTMEDATPTTSFAKCTDTYPQVVSTEVFVD